jgi:hypothetical protein
MAILPEKAEDLTEEARARGRAAERSRPFKGLVRTGFVARGVTYGVIGALSLALAAGAGTDGAAANQQGALALIARFWLGKLALILIAAGLLAYALWKLGQGIFGWGPETGEQDQSLKDRVAGIGGGVVYIGFFLVAIRVLTGSAGNSRTATKNTAAGVLGWPGGQVLVAIAGGVLIAISLYQLWEALSGRFARENKTSGMNDDERRLFMTIGRVGLSARALVFVLVGYFVLRAAITFHPSDAVSLDGALARLHHQPAGPWLLGLVGLGLLTFAAFSLFEARYRRL